MLSILLDLYPLMIHTVKKCFFFLSMKIHFASDQFLYRIFIQIPPAAFLGLILKPFELVGVFD